MKIGGHRHVRSASIRTGAPRTLGRTPQERPVPRPKAAPLFSPSSAGQGGFRPHVSILTGTSEHNGNDALLLLRSACLFHATKDLTDSAPQCFSPSRFRNNDRPFACAPELHRCLNLPAIGHVGPVLRYTGSNDQKI